ncbi:hypothetical protein [Erythrobacter alti]|uniref:hypothetical protein n=1 Tax=Erythrobacter alti TaxID=1896145 RepID=UPI0030F3C615
MLNQQPQDEIPASPYDCWVTPDGDETAQFYRTATGYCVRFPDQADFLIDVDSLSVQCIPADGMAQDDALILYYNSIQPMLGNYRGQLHMHASAVRCGTGAIGFLGLSRRGKTTLAGAFASAGHPFLTEDVLSITISEDGYLVQPSRPVLRLFSDSAALLAPHEPEAESGKKISFSAQTSLPHWSRPCPLTALFLLGPGESEITSIERLQPADALTQLMRHSFILDVEDRPRLKAHFDRIAALARATSCFALDYPRRYGELHKVIETVSTMVTGEQID